MADPFGRNIAVFRDNEDRHEFGVEMHNVAEMGMGMVLVKRHTDELQAMVILEAPISFTMDPLRHMGAGFLRMDTRLGDHIPHMMEGDFVVVLDATGQKIGFGEFMERD